MTIDPSTPIRTTLDELFKIGPGPSSSHTMGPTRITYDFHRRASALPADVLARATGIEVHLHGSLSATGKGHGTDRASLAGLLGPATFAVGLANVVFQAPRAAVPHPNTMSVRLLASGDVLFELE